MTVNDRGDHGEPVISNPPSTVADMTAIITYARNTGNRVIVGNYADMTSNFVNKFGSDPWDGLEAFNTDDGSTSVYNASTGQWEDANASGAAQTSGAFTPASGWGYTQGGNTGSQTLVQGNGQAQVYISFFRTGGNITVPSDGNITNVVVGTLSLHPKLYSVAASGANGRIAHFGIGTSGQVSLTAVTPGANIATGDGFSFGLTYFT